MHRHPCLLIVFLALVGQSAMAVDTLPQATEGRAETYHVRYRGARLAALAEDLWRQSGVAISVPPALASDRVSRDVRAGNWAEVVRQVFQGYDYAAVSGDQGQLLSVFVHARVQRAAAPTADVRPAETKPGSTQASTAPNARPGRLLPARFQGLNPASVAPIAIPFDRLSRLRPGESVSLPLGGAEYRLLHDRRWVHANGETSWVGYLDQAGKLYRAVLTYGADGSLAGSIATPSGVFKIEQADGSAWAIDVKTSGLRPGTLAGDQQSSEALRAAAAATGYVGATRTSPSAVDLMVLYEPGVNEDRPVTRINHLVALTQQAFVDSEVFVRLRLVHAEELGDEAQRSNLTALRDLTQNRVGLDVAALRVEHGADLVLWLRPLQVSHLESCGVAWVAGSNDRPLSADAGFAVVADGYDSGYFCHDYTFAHELGHAFGNVHDQAVSSPGIFPFSYAWGIAGHFATIMSYLFDVAPLVGKFANPELVCTADGLACGDADTADNARTINLTAPTVARFMDQRHP